MQILGHFARETKNVKGFVMHHRALLRTRRSLSEKRIHFAPLNPQIYDDRTHSPIRLMDLFAFGTRQTPERDDKILRTRLHLRRRFSSDSRPISAGAGELPLPRAKLNGSRRLRDAQRRRCRSPPSPRRPTWRRNEQARRRGGRNPDGLGQ